MRPAGSIVGACTGLKGIGEHCCKPLSNTVHSYLIGQKPFKIDDPVLHPGKQPQRVYAEM